jgi:hypothetical protein
VRILRKQNRKAIHLPPPFENNKGLLQNLKKGEQQPFSIV